MWGDLNRAQHVAVRSVLTYGKVCVCVCLSGWRLFMSFLLSGIPVSRFPRLMSLNWMLSPAPTGGAEPAQAWGSAGGCSRDNGQGKHPCTVITHPTPQSEQNVVKPMVCSFTKLVLECTRSHTRTCFCAASSQGRCVYLLGLRLSGLGIQKRGAGLW